MSTTTDLQEIPGVGPRTQDAFDEIGIREVRDLKGRDPAELYVTLSAGYDYLDRCVLYVFRCAVYYAETKRPDPELLKWWNWKDRTHENERVDA